MVEESDGIIEELNGQLRIAVAGASRVAERVARLREDLARQGQASTEQRTRELQVRFDAEQGAARAAIAPSSRAQWWETASTREIADAYETAHAWEATVPEFAESARHMRREIHDRYGIDLGDLHAEPAAVRAALDHTVRDRTAAMSSREAANEETKAGAAFLATAERTDAARDRADRETDQRNASDTARGHEKPSSAFRGAAYDSDERRVTLADGMRRSGVDVEVIRGRIAADRNQATHPREAAQAMTTNREARKAVSTSLERQRGGLSR